MEMDQLKALAAKDLLALAEELEVEDAGSLSRQEMLFAVLREAADNGDTIYGGTLEILSDGFGFLRSAETNYLAGPADVYIQPTLIRKFALRTGDLVKGEISAPGEQERYFAIERITEINYEEPEKAKHRVNFDNLTALYPEERFKLEVEGGDNQDMTGRAIDLVAPIGKGQRALLTAPPRTGKTMMLQSIAHSITANNPVDLLVLLIDERPEKHLTWNARLGRSCRLDLRRASRASRPKSEMVIEKRNASSNTNGTW